MLRLFIFGLFNIFLFPAAIANSEQGGSGINFIQNNGQVVDCNNNLRPDILFSGFGKNTEVYLRKTGISYVIKNEVGIEPYFYDKLRKQGFNLVEIEEAKKNQNKNAVYHGYRIDLNFIGCNNNVEVIVQNKIQGHHNYYYAHCPNGITNVPSYNKIIYKNIYPNIDVVYYGGRSEGLKYDFIVHPGGNPKDIKLEYEGADDIFLSNNQLTIKNSVNDIKENLPVVFQNINGRIIEIETVYILDGTTVKLNVKSYDDNYDLIIDPWATYYGGPTFGDGANSISGDDDGNAAVAGSVNYAAFPVSAGAFQIAYQANTDGYVISFDANGGRLWATYFGGTAMDACNGVCNAPNEIVVVGSTSSNNFPVTAGAYQTNLSGAGDAYIAKFNSITGVLSWSTLYGGSSSDGAEQVDIDVLGNILFVGSTTSADLPVPNAIYPALSGGSDIFIAKLNAAGTPLWATYYGGTTGSETGNDITTDLLGNVAITGYTSSTNFPVSAGAFQLTTNGLNDAFVVKLATNGTRIWASYCGASEDDFALSVAMDSSGDVVITGQTNQIFSGANFPITAGAYRTAYGNSGYGFDIFLTKFNAANGTLAWSTYVGYNGDIEGSLCGIDKSDDIFVFWEPEDYDPNVSFGCDAYQKTFGGGLEDQIISKFGPLGNHLCDTFLGGGGEEDMDGGSGAAFDVSGNFFYASALGGILFPVTPGAFQTAANVNAFGNSTDMYIAKICSKLCGAEFNESFTWAPTLPCASATVNFNVVSNNNCDTTFTTYEWTFNGASISTSTDKNPQGITFSTPGNYLIKFKSITPCKIDSSTQTIIISDNPVPTLSSLSNITCNGYNDGIISVSSSGGTPTYTYQWSNSQTVSSISNLGVGSYSLEVTDSNGCVGTMTASISQPAVLSASVNGTSIICGSSFATVTASAAGGTSAYSYSWSSTSHTSQTVTGLSLGNYSLTITDANGCSLVETFTVTGTGGPSLSVQSQNNVNCFGGNNGTATVSASGGSGAYTYSWSNSQSGNTATGLNAGTYTVVVSDASACTQTISINITQPAQLSSSLTATACGTYSLNGFVYNAGGVYNQTITSALGCDSIIELTLTINPAVQTSDTVSICQGQSIFLHGIERSASGIYTQTFTSGNNCDSISALTLLVNPLPTINTTSDTTILTGSSITLIASGGNTYTWSTGENSNSITVQPTGTSTYIVTITDNEGCMVTDTIVITVISEDLCDYSNIIFVPTSFSPNGDAQNDELKLFSTKNITGIYFAIYNRWGEKIFETDNTYTPWNGTFRNKPCDTGVYIYLLKIDCTLNGDVFIKNGNISLLK